MFLTCVTNDTGWRVTADTSGSMRTAVLCNTDALYLQILGSKQVDRLGKFRVQWTRFPTVSVSALYVTYRLQVRYIKLYVPCNWAPRKKLVLCQN